MLQNMTAEVDIRLGVLISVLSVIPVLAVIYAAESAKCAGFRQKSADCARQFERTQESSKNFARNFQAVCSSLNVAGYGGGPHPLVSAAARLARGH